MENTTRFDLNEAVRQWRDKLSGSLAFRTDNLDELEAHLSSSVERLQANGLPVEEAFRVASHRLGDITALEKEYGKVNAESVWSIPFRILAGLVTVKMVFPVAMIVNQLLLLLGLRMGMGLEVVNAVGGIIEWGVAFGFVYLVWRLAKSNHKRLEVLIFKNWQQRALTALGLLVIMMSLTSLNGVLGRQIVIQEFKILATAGALTKIYARFAAGDFQITRWPMFGMIEVILTAMVILILAWRPFQKQSTQH